MCHSGPEIAEVHRNPFSRFRIAMSPIIELPVRAAAARSTMRVRGEGSGRSRVTLHWTRLLQRTRVCNPVVENAFCVPARECDERLRDERQSFRSWVNELPLSVRREPLHIQNGKSARRE